VLLDLCLPDGDGLAALDAVVGVAPALPVIVLTGRYDPMLGDEALRRGAQDYLDKGWTNQRLLTRAVRYAIERRAAERELRATKHRLSTALEATLDGFGLFTAVRDGDGQLVDFLWEYVNAAGAATYGVEPGELVGRRMLDTTPGTLFDDYRHMVQTGGPLVREAAVSQIGTERGRVYDIRAATLHDGLVVTWRDVTALKQAAGYARSLIEAGQDPMVAINAAGEITDVNEAAVAVTGLPREVLLGSDYANYSTAPALARETFRQVFAQGATTGMPLTIRHRDGQLIDTLCNASLYGGGAGNPQGVVVVARDITERKRQEEALVEALERFRAAFSGAPIGVALVSLDPATPGQYLQVNEALCGLLGRHEDELVGRSVLDVTHPDDAADLATSLGHLADATIERYSADRRYLRADGHQIWVRVHASPVQREAGRPSYAITHVEDITDAKQAQEQLTRRALHDPLTGLANRDGLVARLQHCLDELGRAAAAVAVLYLDLDGFKTVNDSVGHAAGDRLLTEVGHRLHQVVRRHDTAARIGGDEFVVVARLDSDHDVLRILDRVRSALAAPVTINGDSFHASASIGVAVAHTPDADPADLLRAADTAMYRAKRTGRGRHEVFNEALQAEAMRRLEMEDDLREALPANRLRLHYQPVINLADGGMTGVEALLRLDHPSLGLLPPAAFLDVAESSGLIIPIGAWVLAEACRQQAAWQASLGRPLQMAVNLSGRQLLQADLCDQVAAAIDSAGVEPARLTLELTETVFIQASRSVLADLEALKARGVRFALDDFGTGFSSLAYLDRFPVDMIKIGPTFLNGIDIDPHHSALLAAIVSLGHTLGLTVIAEGIETPDQLAAVHDVGCDLVQGFHFARPHRADQIPTLIDRPHLTTGTPNT
jgi:diguanylate cyclase (GGDEF)-like protein/PAS domain S-box-containing protein